MPAVIDEELMTPRDVALRLGVSGSYVRQIAASGQLPTAFNSPLGRLFSPAAVEAFERERAARRAER